jgi:putative endopeptidase
VAGIEERWKFVQDAVTRQMGDAVGQLYCDQAYDEKAAARMDDLIKNVKQAFRDRLSSLPWMTEPTRKYAVMKLDSMVWMTGRPAKWRDYTSVAIEPGSFYENIFNLKVFNFNRDMAKVGKPVDNTEWEMPAPTVNAFYNPSKNQIVFPAGILQPPFFDKNADDAVIYGAIGAVIGHEIIHGFDDQGSKFDYKGNLKNWWTAEDSAAFAKLANRIVEQYSVYTVNENLKVNGKLTLGENIADIGGLAIAYQAYQYSRKSKPALPTIDGFTPDQRFFLSFAQVWRVNIRPEEAARRILTDPHSPGRYRCNGVTCNMDTFYKAFNVMEGEQMYRKPDDRVVIW